MTIKQINNCQTIEDLENLDIGDVDYEIGHRGGHLGFSGSDVAEALDVSENCLGAGYGVYCNYLGGGIRGAIGCSGYSKDVPKDKVTILDALAEACKRVYTNIENNSGLNDDEYEDGDTNWDAIATKAARKAGTKSAY